MSASNSFVILDTMVVAGIIGLDKTDPVQLKNKERWVNAVSILLKSAGKSTEVIAPTSICYELMTYNQSWYSIITKYPQSEKIFKYATFSISNEILKIAARYSINSFHAGNDDTRHKIKSLDSITAAYSLKFGYPIITENQSDFIEPYFSISEVESAITTTKNGQSRRLLYLLTPSEDHL